MREEQVCYTVSGKPMVALEKQCDSRLCSAIDAAWQWRPAPL